MSAVACPLRESERSMDVLYVAFPPACATAEWLALVALAAKEYQQAGAIWASRRQAQVHAAIERELERARQIQLRLVPQSVTVPGLDLALNYHPCHWVAGDYVDVVPTKDGRVLLAVGDVSGKGLEAALTSSSVHSMVHVSIRAGVGLVEMMQGLNDHLRTYLPDDTFVTMLALLLDPATGELEYVNAGHPPALVVTAGGELRELVSATNLPLAVGPDTFVARRERLEAGELLSMFSDGLTELSNEKGQLLGLKALARHLAWAGADGRPYTAAETAERLNDLLAAHRGRRMPDDDCTLLLARRL
jgi:serine phosphatase RsbU (regulator of sigma subunit)